MGLKLGLSHYKQREFNPLNAELNLICHLLALLGAHHILHISRVRVKKDEVTGHWRRRHEEDIHNL
jgi:hypothetical protein